MGLVREEQSGGHFLWNGMFWGLHDVTIGVLVGVMYCGFVECHGQTRGRALKSVVILEEGMLQKDTARPSLPRTR